MSVRTWALLALVGGLWACQETPVPVVVLNPPVSPAPLAEELQLEVTCPQQVPDVLGARDHKGRLVVVFKRHYLLGFYRDGQLVQVSNTQPACFPVAMGDNPSQPKTQEDYQSTPEGWYRVGRKIPKGATKYHQALAVSYPNTDDAERALAAGIINAATRHLIKRAEREHVMPPQHTAMGGDILIHGSGSFPKDWTWGCVALDNQNIDWLYAQVKEGDEILLLPWSTSTTEGG